MNRFKVIEYSSGYAIYNRASGKRAWMSDGVDALFTPTGKAMTPGSEYFRKAWERVLNMDKDETQEAYFPKQ
jgi:hypothetical protein